MTTSIVVGMNGVFSNTEILDESPSTDDLLGYKDETDRVEKRIQATIKNGKSTVIAYMGAFGVGKSTTLNNVKKELGGKANKWVVFETWRYANRNELWDAFVIKIAAEIKGKEESQIAKSIDGNKIKLWLILLLTLGAFLLLSGISYLLYYSFNDNASFLEAYLKYATPVIVSILLLVGLGNFLSSLSHSEPLKRTFQLEDLLRDTLSKMQKPLVVIIEDVDRANEDASIFMEALHEFIAKNNKQFKYPVVAIAPQSNGAFDAVGTERKKHIEHSLKVYDEKMYFNSPVEHATVDAFYEKLSFNTQYEKYKPTMIEVTKEITFYFKKEQLTIRMLKHALREVNWFIQSYTDHNPSVALVYALARVLKDGDDLAVRRLGHNKNLEKHTTHDQQTKFIISPTNIFAACLTIAAGAEGTGTTTGFLHSNGKFNQSSMYKNLVFKSDKDNEEIVQDEVENGGHNHDQDHTKRLHVYVRKTYAEQLTI